MKAVSLFCGSGGFCTGANRAGVFVSLACDVDEALTWSFTRNFPQSRLLIGDISDLKGATIRSIIGDGIDVVFGGPPCQGFSMIGQRNTKDPRRLLLTQFFRLVREIEPTAFVMENVIGLTQGEAKAVLVDALEMVSDDYSIAEPMVLDAAEFGGATNRRRLFVIGMRKTRADRFSVESLDRFRRPAATVEDAILDLSRAIFVRTDKDSLDYWRLLATGDASEYARKLHAPDRQFTGHRLTAHSKPVQARFRSVTPGKTDKVGRHPRLAWSSTCPVLRAGTGPDRGSFQSVRPIHPSEPRVITVREAARLQGFADNHVFHPTIWHSFRMIGNSVSPIVAYPIFRAIQDMCEPMATACARASRGD